MLFALHLATQSHWPLFALLPAALVLALWAYRRTTPPLAPRQRLVLTALRATAYACLCLVLASPVWNRERHDPQRARIAVLIDESASMSNNDGPGGPTRLERARTALGTLRDALRGAPVDLEVVPFAAAPDAPQSAEAYLAAARTAVGPATDPLGAMAATADRLRGQNLQAIVLLSDGRPTQGGLDPGSRTDPGQPVFAIGLGDSLAGRDLAIGRCEYSSIAYVESEAEIDVRIESSGFRGQASTLHLRQGERDIFSTHLRFDQDRSRVSVRVPVQLHEPGRQRYRLVLDALPGERTERNNAREISIEVLRNRIRVLVVAARPDWDVAFWARALRSDPSVRPTVVTQDVNGGWRNAEDGRAFEWPRGVAWTRDYDLYILGTPGTAWRGDSAKELRTAVERGKGLLVLGGRDGVLGDAASFEAIGPLLPVARLRVRGTRFGQSLPRLAPQGRLHPVTGALLPLADAAGTLTGLPPLLGQADLAANVGALTLLSTDANPALPLLVVGRAGEGQVAVVNGFPLWRWGFAANPVVRQSVGAFTSGMVRWLTQPRDITAVQVTTPKPVYESGAAVEIYAHVLDPQYAPLADAQVRTDVRRVDDGSPSGNALLEPRGGQPGEYQASIPGLAAGEYEAEAVATHGGREVGRARVRFTVDAYSIEFADARQDVDFLREIAARTGGRYVGPEAVAGLVQDLPHAARDILVRSEIEIWNTTPLFVLFVLVLGVEWLMRKRFGLL